MSETKVLHTDLLERQYGPVHVEIRRHDDVLRIVDISDDRKVCRTHAITWLSAQNYPRESEFGIALAEIRTGASLGKTFRAHGFGIEKELITQGMIQIPEWLKGIFQVVDDQANFRIYDFIAVDGSGARFSYGVVCEIDSPDFQSGEGLNQVALEEANRARAIYYLKLLGEYLQSTNDS